MYRGSIQAGQRWTTTARYLLVTVNRYPQSLVLRRRNEEPFTPAQDKVFDMTDRLFA